MNHRYNRPINCHQCLSHCRLQHRPLLKIRRKRRKTKRKRIKSASDDRSAERRRPHLHRSVMVKQMSRKQMFQEILIQKMIQSQILHQPKIPMTKRLANLSEYWNWNHVELLYWLNLICKWMNNYRIN